MAVLLNDTSNLRFRLTLLARESDGVHAPASLRFGVAMEAFRHREDGEHAFEPLVALHDRVVLDMDVLGLAESLEALLEGSQTEVAFGTSFQPHFGLRLEPLPAEEAAGEAGPAPAGAPGGGHFLVEAGIDLAACLEPVGGSHGGYGRDLSLFRFVTTSRAIAGFVLALMEEYSRFPTDPSQVSPGAR